MNYALIVSILLSSKLAIGEVTEEQKTALKITSREINGLSDHFKVSSDLLDTLEVFEVQELMKLETRVPERLNKILRQAKRFMKNIRSLKTVPGSVINDYMEPIINLITFSYHIQPLDTELQQVLNEKLAMKKLAGIRAQDFEGFKLFIDECIYSSDNMNDDTKNKNTDITLFKKAISLYRTTLDIIVRSRIFLENALSSEQVTDYETEMIESENGFLSSSSGVRRMAAAADTKPPTAAEIRTKGLKKKQRGIVDDLLIVKLVEFAGSLPIVPLLTARNTLKFEVIDRTAGAVLKEASTVAGETVKALIPDVLPHPKEGGGKDSGYEKEAVTNDDKYYESDTGETIIDDQEEDDATETSEVANANETSEVANANETSEVANAIETSEVANAIETSEVANAIETSEVANAIETSEESNDTFSDPMDDLVMTDDEIIMPILGVDDLSTALLALVTETLESFGDALEGRSPEVVEGVLQLVMVDQLQTDSSRKKKLVLLEYLARHAEQESVISEVTDMLHGTIGVESLQFVEDMQNIYAGMLGWTNNTKEALSFHDFLRRAQEFSLSEEAIEYCDYYHCTTFIE